MIANDQRLLTVAEWRDHLLALLAGDLPLDHDAHAEAGWLAVNLDRLLRSGVAFPDLPAPEFAPSLKASLRALKDSASAAWDTGADRVSIKRLHHNCIRLRNLLEAENLISKETTCSTKV
jgi:hypothetical protein